MEEVTSGEVEERGGLCAESVCDDQVPAVGQQTEVGGESDSGGEGDDVVSSLTGFSNPESCTGRNENETSPEQISGGASQTHDSPDSVQQEQAVTTSSESCSSVVPHETCSGTGSSEAQKVERVCNLVNYDSSDSDDSSVKTPTIENLEEEDGQVFQYPDSNSKTVEYGGETDTGEVAAGSGVRASNEQTIGTAEQTEGGYQDGGYWNEDGCWVDSQGQVWQPPEGYWQQDWTQGTEGEEGMWQDYGVDHGQGCDSQTQPQNAQAGQENEWVTQGEANLEQPDRVEEAAAHQPQGHFSNQEQSAGHCSTSTSSERLHYDQSAYQDGSSRQQPAHSGANMQSSNDAQNFNPQGGGSNGDTTYVQSHKYTSSDPNVTPSYDPRVQQHAHAYPAQHTYGHQDYYQQGGENQQQRQQQQYTGPVQQEQYHSYSQEYHDQHQSYTQNSAGRSGYQYPGQQSHGSGWNYGGDDNSSWYQQQPAGAASHGLGHDTQNRHHGFEQGYHSPRDYERPPSSQFAPGGPPHGQPPPAPYGIPHPPPSHPPPHTHHYSPHSAPPPPSHLPIPTPPPPHQSTPPPLSTPPPQPHLSTPPPPPHLPTPPPYSSLSDPSLPPLLPPRPPPQSISHSSYSPSPQTHHVDEHYSRSTHPRPSRQHHSHSNHSNTSWRKWKYYRRESSHSRSSHYSSSGVPSSPANSVSSDVSSTSRDSPAPVQHSPVAGSPDDSERHRPVSKTVFSNQLRDPRRCSPPVSVREKSPSMKGTRYNSSSSNLTNKKTSSRKESSGSSPSSTRSTKETEQKKVEKPDVKDSKQTNTKKQSATEPASFPKSSLTGFRIPKHSEKGKSQSDNPSTPARLTTPTTKVNNKEEKPKTNADISQARSGVGTTSGSAAETVGSQPVAAPEEAKVDSEAKEPVKESITTPQVSTENSLPPVPTPQQDLVSLFKSIDSTTLSALASTIQLALNSNSGQKMKLSTGSEEKVPSPLTTTIVETVKCKDGLKQPTLPANAEVEVFSATSSVPTASITPQDVKTDVSREAEYSSADTHKVLKEGKSDNDMSESGSAKEAVRCEHDILPDAMPAQSLKRNSKALVVGPPRRVIATVLSTNVPPPHLENPKKSTELTVCIPIHKEVKLHVKSTKDSPKEAEEKMSDRDVANKEAGEKISDRNVANKEAGEKMSDRDVANKEAGEKTSDRDVANKEAGEKISDRDVANKEAEERMNDRDVAKTKDADKPSEEETNEAEIIPEENQPTDIKSPTLSLLKAQDLMFDPKFMYKEYNLRRVRKQEVSPEQSKPQKKKKLDKTSPASKQKGTEKGDELDSKEKDAEPDMSPRLDRVKRGRVEGDKDLSCEPPESKKPREDAEEVEAEATRGESEKQTNPKDDELKGLLDFQVSIPCHGSPPLPLTLTQLLSIPKNDEQNQNSKFAECSPTKEVEKHSKRKNVVKTGSSVAKAAPSVGGGVPEHRLSERSQLICSLCKLKGGISNLGFLFGPYFYHPDTESSADSSTTSSNVEVWLHEDCAVWAAGICLVGRELKGLTEALADASKMVCTACKRPGATLFCASRGCKNIYHFPCAIEKGCALMEDNFQTHCPKHKDVRVQIDS